MLGSRAVKVTTHHRLLCHAVVTGGPQLSGMCDIYSVRIEVLAAVSAPTFPVYIRQRPNKRLHGFSKHIEAISKYQAPKVCVR